jgi:cellulose synthase/poly-beta-1,6-N-acetylglucosamine synthase-like glycosyltransferase
MIQTLFWIALGILVYTYLGYGVVISFMAFLKKRFSKKAAPSNNYYPEVTLVVPAYNEEDFISTKLQNSLELKYPKNRLKLLFITDGSTDATTDILRKQEGITVLHSDQRGGKSAALNRAMQFIETEIVVFNDANTLLAPDAMQKLAQKFSDLQVGGVSGEKQVIIRNEDGTSAHGEGLYWKYESFLKKKDAEVHSVMGAAGELIAFRSALVEHLDEDVILDDFMMTFSIINKGFKVDYAPEVRAVETASANVTEELKRKTRIAAGGWQAMSRMPQLLKFWKSPLLSFMYISHRVLRWSVSAFLLPVLFLLNIALVGEGSLFTLLMGAQIVFYAFASIGYMQQNKTKPSKLFFIPYYFVLMNYAVFAGFLKFMKGTQSAIWERSLRTA